MQGWPTVILACAAALGCALLTRLAIHYAHRRAMLDRPGQRRLHRDPTARGGGVAIVAVLLAGAVGLIAAGRIEPRPGIAFCIGLALVAGIGWIDDHRPLSARLRLLVHFVAAGTMVSQLPPSATGTDAPASLLWSAVQVLALATAVNFWNFMDGANGLVASQSLWVAACVALLFALAGSDGWSLLAVVLAASTLGFLPFNFPRARVFMGDVGSGGLGFACGSLLLLAERLSAASVWSVVAIVSVLAFDAGLTLLSRFARGRRWYTPHREHLYQWLVRSGSSHARVTVLYLAWNLLFVLPLIWLSHEIPHLAPLSAVVVALAAIAAWVLGRRFALRRASARRPR
jgi:UDP-N-acetylmuramyl pentapeptide phosphotransferase/UDP-N-acetylglucosamine-1-phosphate transferase